MKLSRRPLLRPGRYGFRHQLVVNVDRIHSLVEKTEQSIDRRTGGERFAIAPRGILCHAVACSYRPVGCNPFGVQVPQGTARVAPTIHERACEGIYRVGAILTGALCEALLA